MDWGGRKRGVLVVIGAVVVLVVFAVLYGWLPWWIDGTRLRHLAVKDQTGALSSDRGDVLKMVAGAGALVALVYTARKHALDREGQVTDRYTKAIAQLASDKLSERIGGIYALERIMADSTRDHPTVVEVLAAFVRQRAPLPRVSEGEMGDGAGGSGLAAPQRPDADVQAAMMVLARRPARDEPFALDLRRTALAGLELPRGARLAGANLEQADLTTARLSEATLTGANLEQADLTGADLSEARLTEASLRRSTLTKADLSMTTLTRANLSGATLTGADLSRAKLTEANLWQATLTGANLRGTTLTGANLKGATLCAALGLKPSQLSDALLGKTELDDALAGDVWVVARIEACKGWLGGPVPAPTPEPTHYP